MLSSDTVHFEIYRPSESENVPLRVSRLSLPLSLWDRFLRGRLLPGHLYETIAGAGLSSQIVLQLYLRSDP